MTRAPFLGFGIGLRREHFDDVLGGASGCDWFEAISENYMDTGGRPLGVLEHVRRDRPVALHGVGLSIGGTDPLDRRYLRNLRTLMDRIQPALVTDHLCWTGVNGRSLYDLLPLPYTEESLAHVIARVRAVQHELGQRLLLENPSTYVAYQHSTIAEWEFLAAVANEADCGILLDVNNVYVSSYNLGFDPRRYLDAIPCDRVAQIHLAGFTDMGTYLFDTHSAPVSNAVWELYAHSVRRCGRVSTLVEWDADIPSFERVCAEASQARRIMEDIDGTSQSADANTAGGTAVDGIAHRASRAA